MTKSFLPEILSALNTNEILYWALQQNQIHL